MRKRKSSRARRQSASQSPRSSFVRPELAPSGSRRASQDSFGTTDANTPCRFWRQHSLYVLDRNELLDRQSALEMRLANDQRDLDKLQRTNVYSASACRSSFARPIRGNVFASSNRVLLVLTSFASSRRRVLYRPRSRVRHNQRASFRPSTGCLRPCSPSPLLHNRASLTAPRGSRWNGRRLTPRGATPSSSFTPSRANSLSSSRGTSSSRAGVSRASRRSARRARRWPCTSCASRFTLVHSLFYPFWGNRADQETSPGTATDLATLPSPASSRTAGSTWPWSRSSSA